MKTGHKEINEIIGLIVKNQTEKADALIKSLKTIKIENGQKIQAITGIDKILNGKRDAVDSMIDLLAMRKFKGYKLTPEQKNSLIKLVEVLKSVKSSTKDCLHKRLEIYKLMHGGGFTPKILIPELVCRDCGLNISFPFFIKRHNEEPHKYINDLNYCIKEFGITLTKEFVENLRDYMKDKDKAHWIGVENILSDPENVFKNVKKMSSIKGLTVINKQKFDSFSGQPV